MQKNVNIRHCGNSKEIIIKASFNSLRTQGTRIHVLNRERFLHMEEYLPLSHNCSVLLSTANKKIGTQLLCLLASGCLKWWEQFIIMIPLKLIQLVCVTIWHPASVDFHCTPKITTQLLPSVAMLCKHLIRKAVVVGLQNLCTQDHPLFGIDWTMRQLSRGQKSCWPKCNCSREWNANLVVIRYWPSTATMSTTLLTFSSWQFSWLLPCHASSLLGGSRYHSHCLPSPVQSEITTGHAKSTSSKLLCRQSRLGKPERQLLCNTETNVDGLEHIMAG